MSEREPKLDEGLREKFLALGEAVSAPLDAEAEQRMVARLRAETARQGRMKRARTLLTGAGVLAAAAALSLVWFARDEPVMVEPALAVCAWGEASLTFSELGDGRRKLALGPAGHVVLASGAEATAVVDAACALRVRLTRGALAAELGDLRPGSLRVQTDLGDVLVRGTTFSVDLREELKVVLLSGAVEFVERERVTARLSPGNALRRARRGEPTLSEASPEDAQRVKGLLRAKQAERAPTPTPTEERAEQPDALEEEALVRGSRSTRGASALSEAEAARREGDFGRARALYAQAAQRGSADAEVALLRHAGFEIERGEASTADKLLAAHRRRFPRSRLAAEAAWIHVRALQAMGDREGTRRAARDLIKQFAKTPQAVAAQRLLEQP